MKNLKPYKLQKSALEMTNDGWIYRIRMGADIGGMHRKEFQSFLKSSKKAILGNKKVTLDAIFQIMKKHKTTAWKKKNISKVIEDIYIQKGPHENIDKFVLRPKDI